MSEPNNIEAGLEPLSGLDKLVHEPARMMIMAYLYVVESADFLFLLRQTGLTKGNLSSHLIKLDAGGYVHIEKKFVDKIPRTVLKLTETGRRAFDEYRKTMEDLVKKLPKGRDNYEL